MTDDELKQFRLDNGHHPKRRYVLNADGQPVKNRFGEYLTPNLTDEDIEEIARLWAVGHTINETSEITGITYGRIERARKELTVIEATERLRITEAIPVLIEAQQQMTDALSILNGELAELRKQVRRLAYHSKYRSIDLAKSRRREASVRDERNALKKAYWKATGRRI